MWLWVWLCGQVAGSPNMHLRLCFMCFDVHNNDWHKLHSDALLAWCHYSCLLWHYVRLSHTQQCCLCTRRQVKILLSSGGRYEQGSSAASEGSSVQGQLPATGGAWRYVGGETRLIALQRTTSFTAFLQQLSKATSAVWDEVGGLCGLFMVCGRQHDSWACSVSWST